MKSLAWQQNRHQKVFYRGLYICAVRLDILKFEQTSLFYSALYLNWWGLELCFGGSKPTKAPRDDRTVWQNFSLLFNAIDSEKYLGYMIFQVKLVRYVTLFVYKHDRAQSGTTHSGIVYSALWGKTCAGTILPSFEHNWLKWSYDKYNTQRQLDGV